MDEFALDKPREECGIFGMYAPAGEEIARSLYYGLSALQHRGQESAGIAICDTAGARGNITWHKAMGLVSEVFHKDTLDTLTGNLGIGHVRYSTTGASSVENAQPLVLNYIKGTLALAHNGNITNTEELRRTLQQNGAIFHSTTDSEVIAYQIARERTVTASAEDAVLATAGKIQGGFALLVMSPRKLIAIRDPLGLKPLCLGKRGDTYVLASESCALTAVNAEFIRDILPGELITISKDGIKSNTSLCSDKQAHCIFEYIYFARLDSRIDGISVYDARIRAGRALAHSYPVDADIVTGVPDSGLAAATGYSQESGIPFALAFQKNSYVGRTFIRPTQSERESAVHLKLSVLESVVKDKTVVLIDDSIVRGTTIAGIITMLKNAGAKAVHVRICSPPFLYPCYYGTDVPSSSQLIASSHSSEEICSQIGADSLGYMKIQDLSLMTGPLPLCQACFDSKYPLSPP
jgi:amidophosphoribosyltransferase